MQLIKGAYWMETNLAWFDISYYSYPHLYKLCNFRGSILSALLYFLFSFILELRRAVYSLVTSPQCVQGNRSDSVKARDITMIQTSCTLFPLLTNFCSVQPIRCWNKYLFWALKVIVLEEMGYTRGLHNCALKAIMIIHHIWFGFFFVLVLDISAKCKQW